MSRFERLPCALTVAGSDSGGGAGIQADLKTFAAHRVHGVSAITCLTAQNPREVIDVHPSPRRFLEAQLAAIESFQPKAAKTGMLYSQALIDVVLAFVELHPGMQLVVDPVMVATSGSKLLKPGAERALKQLIRRATVITPNLAEAEILGGERITTVDQARRVARKLNREYGCAVLLKGGHLARSDDAVDVLADGAREHILETPRIRRINTHGTGCTLSAAITANLALGKPLLEAVRLAKRFIHGAIAGSNRVAAYSVLNPFWR